MDEKSTSAVASAAARFSFAPSDPLPVTTRAYGIASRAVASRLAPSATISSASGTQLPVMLQDRRDPVRLIARRDDHRQRRKD